MNRWLVALLVVVAGFVLASVLAPIVRKIVGNKRQPDAIRELAPVAGTFVFFTLIALGILAGVAQTNPETLKPMPAKLINYFPKVLVAGVMLMAGNVVGQIVSLGVGKAALKATGERKVGVERLVRSSILALFGLLAVGQLGVNTTVVNMLVGATLLFLALAAALLVGLGGRDVARHVAAGRYLRGVVAPGAVVEAGDVTGTVLALRPASLEVQHADGTTVHVPNGSLLGANVRVVQPAPAPLPE